MQFELGQFKGASTVLTAAPALATVWSSDGGQATMAVTQKLSTAGGGGSGGTSSTFKLTISRSGKGTVTSNPAGLSCGNGGGCSASYTANTSVTLTATPDPGAAWTGWSGACSGTATTCTMVLNANVSVTASFR